MHHKNNHYFPCTATDKVHNLDPDALKHCEVVNIDIAGDVQPHDYKEEQDPTLFVSEKTGRGPLDRDHWMVCIFPLTEQIGRAILTMGNVVFSFLLP